MNETLTEPTTFLNTLQDHQKAWSEFRDFYGEHYAEYITHEPQDIPFEIQAGMLVTYINQFEDLKKQLDKYSLSFGNEVLKMAIHEAFEQRNSQL